MWRRNQQQEPKEPYLKTDLPQEFPTGAVLRVGGELFYVISGKRYLVTKAVEKSWNFPKIVRVRESTVAHMPIKGHYGFRDGSILEDVESREFWYIAGGKRHKVVSPKVFDLTGRTVSDAILAARREIEFHVDGGEI